MPVIPFPTPNSSAADLRRAGAVARKLALGVRFRGRPADAARFVLAASPFEVAQALAADDTLALVKAHRALRRAHRVGDLDTVRHLHPMMARLCARLTEVARRHCVRGWHLALIVGLGLIACHPLPAIASSTACESVRDHDRREACRAETSGRSSDCESMRNADARAECRAKTE